jgi:catechol 2,3-dioxygenase-like lactoylglutathione lyase family enzyme
MDKTTYPRIKKMSPQLIVRDIARSIAFYTEILGFDLDFRYEDFYAGMIKDGHSIHLKSGTPSTEERKNKRKNEDLDLVFSVDGIEALFIQLLNNPVEIIQPLRNMPYGKEFYLVDPDGYIISFLEEA